MNLRLLAIVSTLFVCVQCSDDPVTPDADLVVQAYDTLELRYQQMGDLAMDLISNVSVDPQVKTGKVPDLLERQPVVSIDFRKPLTTRKDIVEFVRYQEKIDAGILDIFNQLNSVPKWQSAPLVLDFRSRYDSLKDSIGLATRHYNEVVTSAKLNMSIPMEPTPKK